MDELRAQSSSLESTDNTPTLNAEERDFITKTINQGPAFRSKFQMAVGAVVEDYLQVKSDLVEDATERAKSEFGDDANPQEVRAALSEWQSITNAYGDNDEEHIHSAMLQSVASFLPDEPLPQPLLQLIARMRKDINADPHKTEERIKLWLNLLTEEALKPLAEKRAAERERTIERNESFTRSAQEANRASQIAKEEERHEWLTKAITWTHAPTESNKVEIDLRYLDFSSLNGQSTMLEGVAGKSLDDIKTIVRHINEDHGAIDVEDPESGGAIKELQHYCLELKGILDKCIANPLLKPKVLALGNSG